MKACVSAGPHTFRQQLQGNACQENESGPSRHEANVGHVIGASYREQHNADKQL